MSTHTPLMAILIAIYILLAFSYGLAAQGMWGYRGIELLGLFLMAATWPVWVLSACFVLLLRQL